MNRFIETESDMFTIESPVSSFSEIMKSFDPSEARDESGRWTDSGGGAAVAEKPSSPESHEPSKIDQLEDRHDNAQSVSNGVLPDKAEMNDTRHDLIHTIQEKLSNTVPESSVEAKEEHDKLTARLTELHKEDYEQNGVKAVAFKQWFGNWEDGEGSKAIDEKGRPGKNVPFSHAVNEDGEPTIVYHGTTHDFDEFRKGGVGNFFGNGHYFSTSRDDVARNYADELGPDRMSRINDLQEKLETEIDDIKSDISTALENIDVEDGLSDEEVGLIHEKTKDILSRLEVSDDFKNAIASDIEMDMRRGGDSTDALKNLGRAVAEEKIIGDNPHVIEAYLNIRNPVVFADGETGTKFDTEYETDFADNEQFVSEMENSFREKAKEFKTPNEAVESILSSTKENAGKHPSPTDFYSELYKATDRYHGDLGEASLSDLTDDASEHADKWSDDARVNLTGTGQDLANAIRTVADNYATESGDDLDVDGIIQDIGLNEEGSVTAEQVLHRLVQSNSGAVYLRSDEDDRRHVPGQFLKDVFERMGFDGVKDTRVSDRFSFMRLGKDTVHWIAFEPNQIKSFTNQGTFDKSTGNMFKRLSKRWGLAKAFDPSEPRDDSGKWTDGGGGTAVAEPPAKQEKGKLRQTHQEIVDRAGKIEFSDSHHSHQDAPDDDEIRRERTSEMDSWIEETLDDETDEYRDQLERDAVQDQDEQTLKIGDQRLSITYDYDEQGWINGHVTVNDKVIDVGGGFVDKNVGDVMAYDHSDIGDLPGLISAVGLDPDSDDDVATVESALNDALPGLWGVLNYDKKREIDEEIDAWRSDRMQSLAEQWVEDNPMPVRHTASEGQLGVWQKDDDDDPVFPFVVGDQNYEITLQQSERSPEQTSQALQRLDVDVSALDDSVDLRLNSADLTFASVGEDGTGWNYKITGKGNAFEVFNTVCAASVAAIQKNKYDVITLSASEPSRQRLYDRLIKFIANVVPDYVAVAKGGGEGFRQYVLIRREHKEIADAVIASADRDPADNLEALVKARRNAFRERYKSWDESQHPRGQPDNSGEFAETDSGEAVIPQFKKGDPPPKNLMSKEPKNETSEQYTARIGRDQAIIQAWQRAQSEPKEQSFGNVGKASTKVNYGHNEFADKIASKGIGFESGSKAAQWTNAKYGQWSKKLSEQQRSAIATYSGGSYSNINDGLRGKGVLEQKDKDTIESLDRTLQVSSLPESIVVFRGATDIGYLGDPNKLVGRTIKEKGYSSVSLMQNVANGFASNKDSTADARFEITVPKGSHAISTDAALGKYSLHQHELVLPRDSKFKISAVEKRQLTSHKTFYIIKAEVV